MLPFTLNFSETRLCLYIRNSSLDARSPLLKAVCHVSGDCHNKVSHSELITTDFFVNLRGNIGALIVITSSRRRKPAGSAVIQNFVFLVLSGSPIQIRADCLNVCEEELHC